MVRFLVGEKGQGKSKRLIEMANERAKNTDGHLVFIANDQVHMYDLSREVRFVETQSFPLSNYREFIGFVCGILSQDNDIKDVYALSYHSIVRDCDNDSLVKLVNKLQSLSRDNDVSFTISLTGNVSALPEEIKALVL